MSLSRLALKNFQQRASSYKNSLFSTKLVNNFHHGEFSFGGMLQRMLLSSAAEEEGKEVAVKSEGKKGRWKSLSPRRFSRRPSGIWKTKDNTCRDPFENMAIPSIGNALIEAAENMNKLFENITPTQLINTPTQLLGRFKETNDSYKLRYDVPGLTHDDIKVTIDNGVLKIRGERKVEEGDEEDDEYWMSYGSYNASLVLPDDAKDDDVKAELKDGVLMVVIPKNEDVGNKDVKEVQIQ